MQKRPNRTGLFARAGVGLAILVAIGDPGALRFTQTALCSGILQGSQILLLLLIERLIRKFKTVPGADIHCQLIFVAIL